MPGSIVHGHTPRRAFRVALLAALSVLCASGSALAATRTKVVTYHGYRLTVPRTWPVYDLAKEPTVCVRFNRHAVYLGRPGAEERCPAHAAGRTESILLEPIGAQTASAASTQPAATAPALPGATSGSSGSVLNAAHQLLITATWRTDGSVIRRALALRSLKALTASADSSHPTASEPRANGRARALARAASAVPALPGGAYTGSGFDACSTPSAAHMSAWGASPYRAIGVYIGGANMACAQPNLSPGWVAQESSAGWHLVPIYVGLQAPSNSCGCAPISESAASSQGSAAAADAIRKAQALGLGVGNPIYFDMEAYARGGSNSPAVLAFLASWTAQLHAYGYKSGIYSSDGSGVADVVSQYGSGYSEPDDIWIANWNGVKGTSDADVPSGDWPEHQRLHQYEGAHNETHGGVTINIDGDYLDAATAAAGGTASTAAEPFPSSPPAIFGKTVEGQTLSEAHGTWPGSPASYAYQWEDCNGAGYGCAAIPGASGQTYTLAPSDLGHAIRLIETASYPGGAGAPATSAATSQVVAVTPFYWLYTAYGNVEQSWGTAWYGSPIAQRFRGNSITGMAATPDGQGYWLVSANGTVYAYGDAARHPRIARAQPILGIVAAPAGGYWLYTAVGNVYPSSGTKWYGSPSPERLHGSFITGMAATSNGKGYWLVDAAGTVFAYGDAARLPALRHANPIKGIVAAPGGGYWLYTAYGNVYRTDGASWYGSPSGGRFRGNSITGMAATADAKGYWLVAAGGAVFAYGDAAKIPVPPHPHPIAGMAG
jgi:Rv2525c-like, glycoside hydrolase-like domain